MNCYEAIDLMGDAMEGVLAPDASAGFQEHLEECAACGNYYEQLRLARRALKNLGPRGGTSQKRSELIARFKGEFEKRG